MTRDILATAFLLVLGCGSGGGAPADAAGSETDAGLEVVDAAPDGQTMPSDAAPPCLAADGPILFFNRNGGMYVLGPADDSRTNTSSVLHGDLLPWPYGDDNWNAILECARGAMAPFNVQVVDVDPGDVPHEEIVFAERLPLGQFVDAYQCGTTIENAISFIDGMDMGDDAHAACLRAMVLVGRHFGFDYSFPCEDFMAYRTWQCVDHEWVNDDVHCGEYTVRPCCTDLPTQNTYQTLLSYYGACP